METSNTNHSILIVEDDDQLRKNMALILGLEGFSVHTAADALTGLTAVRNCKPALILSDILMPEMDGFAFQKTIQADPAYADICFIFVSALGDQKQIRKGMLAGADDYLPKPFTAEDLINAVTIRLARMKTLRQQDSKDGLNEQALTLPHISKREKEILELVSKGSTSKEIATKLYISPRTVEVHRARLMKKLGASNAAALSSWANVLEKSSN